MNGRSKLVRMLVAFVMGAITADYLGSASPRKRTEPLHAHRCNNQRVARRRARWRGVKAVSGKGCRA